MQRDFESQPPPQGSSIPEWRRKTGLALLVVLPIAGLLLNLLAKAALNRLPEKPLAYIPVPIVVDPDEPRHRGIEEVETMLHRYWPQATLIDTTEIESLPDVKSLTGRDYAEPHWRLHGQFTDYLDDERATGSWDAQIFRSESGYYNLWFLRYSLGGITRHRVNVRRADYFAHRADSDMSNRVIAEFILAQGATVEILVDGEPQLINDVKNLPIEPFILRDTTWSDAETIRAGLGPLIEWIGIWDVVTTARPDRWHAEEETYASQMSVRQRLGGRFLVVHPFQEYRNLWSLSVITYDPSQNRLVRWSCQLDGWVDQFTGELDKAARAVDWTVVDDSPFVVHQTWRLAGPDRIEGTNAVPMPGNSLSHEMALDTSYSMCREGERRVSEE